MVAFGRLAIISLAASANALSLFSVFQNVADKAMESVNDKIGLSGQIIHTFPGQDERPVPGNSPIIQCDAKTPQILDLQRVVIDPNPPAKGQNLTFVATGFLSEDITDGAYVDVDVRYGYIRLIHQTFDLCEEVTNVDLECPIKEGQQIISKLVEIPNEVPPGKYIVNARAYTKEDVLITCLSATVEFLP
ncbi:CIC11C00000005897 [Sungouiella intermedia]|uniref:Phosphatidylglycerol/phosphatidylinositol transfer protein n=1 Tax=Sungouiella intermedia TaxID=45354 RepID=A0A1L0CWH1_9ASCO|nr:CIC11C00000005897 [[Candida] intermedia]